MARPRSLRLLFLANDGSSAGHVARALAVARAVIQEGARRKLVVRPVLATASDATALIESQGIPYVRLPSRASTETQRWTESDVRALWAGILGGVVAGFAPDVLVADTFPAGPHCEAADLLDQIPCRVLLRRTVRPEREDALEVRSLLEGYQRVILPDDPATLPPQSLPVDSVSVPPITLLERSELLPRAEARRQLQLPSGKLVLLVGGGGADQKARGYLHSAAAWLKQSTRYVPVLAHGPLAPHGPAQGVVAIPLQRYLLAFDLAIASAGYNAAHELAKSGVRAVLFGCPRAFDDQEARARRFEDAGLAIALQSFEPEALAEAVSRAEALPRPSLPPEGARAAARIILSELQT